MFPESIIMEKLKYVQPWVKGLFSGNIPAVPLPGRLKNFIINWGTLTQDQLWKFTKYNFKGLQYNRKSQWRATFHKASSNRYRKKFRKC